MSISNAYFDIRKLYKNIKDVNWESQNVFYNTVLFSLNCKIDVEFSIDIWNLYRDKIPYFKDWEIKEHNKKGQHKLVPKNYDGYFSADIMTGWWNPFKYFVGLTGGERENICRIMLYDKIPKSNDINELLKWFQGLNKDIQKKEMESFLSFLEVIYTIGNIIPSPVNCFYGTNLKASLDDWYGKQTFIFKLPEKIDDKATKTERSWYKYISSCYEGKTFKDKLNNFIIKNYLQEYFDDDVVKSFWKTNICDQEPTIATKATPQEWAKYFNNATDYINNRSKTIYDAKPKGDE